MTAASPRTSPSALRSPLPPSITHSTRPASVSPRASRSCSSSVHTTAFSVEPSRRPSGTLSPARVIARTTITVCWATTTPSMNNATTSSSSRRRARCSCSRCRVRRTTVRLTVLLLLPRVGRPLGPRLETAVVVAHRHPGQQLLHHPRGQRVPVAKRRDRRQRRFPTDRRPHAGAAHLHAPPAEGELRRRRAPVMMGARPVMPAFGARQRHGLFAKQLVQRGQPVRMDPREQVLACRRHPGEHRLHQVRRRRACAILRLRSLCSRCSLRHWRLLGPGWGTVCLGRRDSHADQGAVATQFSSSTGAGTSPALGHGGLSWRSPHRRRIQHVAAAQCPASLLSGGSDRLMNRRSFIGKLALGILAVPRLAPAQPERKVYRIGVLSHIAMTSDLVGPQPRQPSVNALVQGLRELGYVYGEHFVTEPRGAGGRPERLGYEMLSV